MAFVDKSRVEPTIFFIEKISFSLKLFSSHLKKKLWLSMGSNQYLAGRVYDLCVYYLTGTPEGSTKSGFMEKPGIEPATPGLQDIGLSPTPRWLISSHFNGQSFIKTVRGPCHLVHLAIPGTRPFCTKKQKVFVLLICNRKK